MSVFECSNTDVDNVLLALGILMVAVWILLLTASVLRTAWGLFSGILWAELRSVLYSEEYVAPPFSSVWVIVTYVILTSLIGVFLAVLLLLILIAATVWLMRISGKFCNG